VKELAIIIVLVLAVNIFASKVINFLRFCNGLPPLGAADAYVLIGQHPEDTAWIG
jgi:hypothetical protein